MQTKPLDNAKLGLFVIAGLAFLIFSLYMIGRNRNFFGDTFTIQASFHNVNGLTTGNNVRFAGIDVGTVRKIEIESDSSILVTMVIDKQARPYIRKKSVASVGSDGLMGNKLININSGTELSPPVEEGDRILSLKPIETDEMLRTLNTTNENFEAISTDLRKITQKINNSNSLWKLLSDSTITADLRVAVKNIKVAGNNAARVGDQLTAITTSVRNGEGPLGTLLTDTALANKLKNSLQDIHVASNQAAQATADIQTLLQKVKRGEGTAGALLSDTTLLLKLQQSLDHVEQGTARFSENMEAMRHNFLFRGYFKKQEKEAKKETKKTSN